MPLSWNEIKESTAAFSKEWKNDFSTDAEAQSFLIQFFNVFGISRRHILSFDHRVKSSPKTAI